MEIKRNVRKAAELGIAVTAIAALLVAGCGGGGVLGLGGSSIVVAGAGNSPFIGVTMKAECKGGETGTGVIGTDAAPGDGTISVPSTCQAPIKISATGKGKMRTIGASGVSQDVDYDPRINLPISNILTVLPTTAASAATANPVTTLVANQFMLGKASVSVALSASSAVLDLNTAQTNVASSVGLTSVASINNDYRDPEIAGVSTRIAQVAVIAAQQAAASGAPATVTAGTKTLGQFIAEKLAAPGASLQSASSVAAQLNSGAAGTKIDITADARVTGATTVAGSIDREAANMKAMVAQEELDAGTVAGLGAGNGLKADTVGAMLQKIAASSNAVVTSSIAEHIQAAKRNDVLNKAAQLVADANALVAASSVKDTRLKAAQAAAAKIRAGMETALAVASGVAADNDVIAQYQVIANGVKTALANDITSSTPVFAAPPTVGVAGAVEALVGKLQGQASSVTAASVTTDAAISNLAAAAMKVTTVIANLAPPPAVGSNITVSNVTTTVTQADKDAYEAALAAMANRMDDTKISTGATASQVQVLQASIDSLKTAIGSKISGVISTAGEDVGELAQRIAQAALPQGIDFAAPPAPGSITAAGITLLTIVPPPTLTAPPTVTVNAVTQAQITVATAAASAATQAATQASAAASAAEAAYTQAVALSTSTATTVGPAQTAANAAQAAATAAHTARVAADAAAAAAAAAFPNSTQATASAAAASSAASSDTLADAKARAAKACYDGLVARLLAVQLAAAQADATHAAGDATAAATQAALAASASASAVAATTTAAAQPFASSAASAAVAAQTLADHAKADAADAAIQLPGSPPATAVAAAATSATAAQASANAAKASSAAAAAAATPVGAPTAVAATAGNASATVSFTAPAGTIIDYRVTSSPGNISMVGMASPIVVTGLTNGTAYTFTVTATNAKGTSAPSSASAAVTPAVPVVAGVCQVTYAATGQTAYYSGIPATPANACSSTVIGALIPAGQQAVTVAVVTAAPAGSTAVAYTNPDSGLGQCKLAPPFSPGSTAAFFCLK